MCCAFQQTTGKLTFDSVGDAGVDGWRTEGRNMELHIKGGNLIFQFICEGIFEKDSVLKSRLQ